MRLIDADALIDDLMEHYCKECDKRKGIKNGKRQFIYEIGGAPCRACEVDDIKAELEEAPTIDAVPVTRCRDCKHRQAKTGDCYGNGLVLCNDGVWRDMEFFCADGERSEDA